MAYCFAIRIASLFNKKAAQWVNGRVNWLSNLRISSKHLSERTIWIHCSSLGEFEQARPLIDRLKTTYADRSMVVSFFSPSGFNIRFNYEYADLVCYLPCDVKGAANEFIDIIKPELVIFVKYDLWLNYFIELKKRNIPLLLVSVIQNRPMSFNPGDLYKKYCYSLTSRIYVQNQQSFNYLKDEIRTNITVAGDTRIDSVIQNADKHNKDLSSNISKFIEGAECMVCGSTWPEDEKLLVNLIKSKTFAGWKAIIAPHEMHPLKLELLKNEFGEMALFYSKIENRKDFQTVLIIDSIGLLSKIYRFGTIAYIGGGFGKGIHNTLEPAAFHIPVIFGPKYQKFTEAVNLVQSGAFKAITNEIQLFKTFEELKSKSQRDQAAVEIVRFLDKNKGGSQIILDDIKTSYLSV